MPKPQTSLFEGTEHDPKPKRFYNRYDCVSYLLKSIRLNRKGDALTAMWCLLNEGTGQWYIAKKLVQFASEDAVGAEAFIYAQGVFQLIKDVTDEVNSLSRLILYLCDAPKMWESEKETEWEVRRIHLREHIKKCYGRGEKPVELPSYVFDVYTARGKAAQRRGEEIDRRVSGVMEGTGLFCRATFLKHGRLDTEDTTVGQAYAPHLLKCLRDRAALETTRRELAALQGINNKEIEQAEETLTEMKYGTPKASQHEIDVQKRKTARLKEERKTLLKREERLNEECDARYNDLDAFLELAKNGSLWWKKATDEQNAAWLIF